MAGLDALQFIDGALYDGLPYSLVGLGLLWTAKYIRFPDLTCSGTFVLGGAVAANAIVVWGWPSAIAVALAILASVAGGLLTGILYVVLRMDRILAGILSAFVLYSINLLLLKPTLAYGSSPTIFTTAERKDYAVSSANVSWHPFVILMLLCFVVGIKLLMDRFLSSEMGLMVRALEDEEAGESVLLRQGISPDKYRLGVLAIGNGIIGLSGALVSFKEGAANAQRGFDVLVTGLIVFLVATQLHKLLHNIAHVPILRTGVLSQLLKIQFTTAAILGGVFYFALISFSQEARIDPGYTKILLAALVAFTVADPGVLRRMRWLLTATTPKPHLRSPSGHVLQVERLHFRYPLADTETLHAFSLEVKHGDFVHLKGSNGSGKTTALRLLAGFLDPQNGSRIVYKGSDVTHDSRCRLTNIAYVDQNAARAVAGILTTEENLALSAIGANPSPWRRALRRDRIGHLAQLFGDRAMPPALFRSPSSQLSGGQRQVVNLLTILARRTLPELVLLDEPANNLDTANRDRCLRVIQSLRERGVAIIWISHFSLPEVDRGIVVDMDLVSTKNVYMHSSPCQ